MKKSNLIMLYLSSHASLFNNGSLDIQPTATYVQESGSFNLNAGGSIVLSSGSTLSLPVTSLTMQGGSLEGFGVVSGTIMQNGGIIAPGNDNASKGSLLIVK